MNGKQGKEIPLWLIVLSFIFAPPLGLVLLFLHLGGVRIPTDRFRQEFDRRTGGGVFVPGQGNQAREEPTKAKRPRMTRFFKLPQRGTGLTVGGAFLSLAFLPSLLDEIVSFGLAYPSDWVPLASFFAAGLTMMGFGIARTRRARRQRLYLGVIGERNSVYLADLAGTAGVSEKQVIADLQRMLSDGILPMGFIDRASGRLVLTDQGYQPPEAQPEPEHEEKKAAPEEDEDAILRQIRDINDAIPDVEMSRKIDRIGEITGKILAYQRQNPEKAGQLRQFLNYYLPTTLKLLRTYAQLDAQGVEGENISAAKTRIEGMMDKVVEGFEKQLDQLFKTDAMDIATDVEVLERMLEKDGLGSGMTMGQ